MDGRMLVGAMAMTGEEKGHCGLKVMTLGLGSEGHRF